MKEFAGKTVSLMGDLSNRRVLMLVENYYPQDTRVRNEACLLTEAGYQVTVIAWRKRGQSFFEDVAGVKAYRLWPVDLFKKTPSPDSSFLGLVWLRFKSLLGYVLEYGYFTAASMILSAYIFATDGIDVIHAHNPPDTLFLVALPYKLLGKKFVFDHHDLCPELYRSRYGAGEGFYSRALGLLEWCSLRLADVTIATNETYKEVQVRRGKKHPDSIFVVRNGPDETRMKAAPPSPRLRAMNKSILGYVGALNPQDGVDYLLRSLRHLRYDLKRKDFHCVIMGSGDSLQDLRDLNSQLQLNDCVELTGFVSEPELRANLSAADVCVDPDPSSPLNDASTWIKIMEYMANAKPIVTFDLKETRYSAQGAASYVPPNDELAFAKAIGELMDNPAQREKLGESGRLRVEQHLQWSITGKNLLKAYQALGLDEAEAAVPENDSQPDALVRSQGPLALFGHKAYYLVKPLLPFSIRLAVRRAYSTRVRAGVKGIWPILPGSERPPKGWSGWPHEKKFAFVLTHDVESHAGLSRCAQLMELEMKCGFRSSFNFIPQGEYRVAPALRDDLLGHGFEVGVHDLKHDGKLYRSRTQFAKNAAVINQCLKDWGAVGFRSGFMFHNLAWLHDLNIQYDASTFDTDPFEPQPDGVGTIFPFWNQSDKGRGYVELPYTMPQDFTVFLLLQECDLRIWFEKLDWIAGHGGMALMNVHPDYMSFNDQPGKGLTYPGELYENFLKQVARRYGDQYWNPLPKQLAVWHKAQLMPLRKTNGHAPFGNVVPKPKPKIWIDLDNTPHVVFFEPVLDELRSRQYPLLVTARDAFQVCELADRKKISYTRVGRHYGKNPALKLAGLLFRALQLAPLALREKPALSLSHGSRSQIFISNILHIPSLLLADYEYAKWPPFMRPVWEMVPSVIPDDVLCRDHEHILRYPGIKEDAYVWKFQPDHRILQELGLSESNVIVTVRPPATEAHYHNPESEKLFACFMDYACRFPQTRLVLLPRNQRQGEFIRKHSPRWFERDKTVVPPAVVDGLNLIWHSDLLVSGGGTMNREATALGIPVYSIFLGAIGAVDRHLQQSGRLTLIKSVADIAGKIRLVKRAPSSIFSGQPSQTLLHIVNTIEELVDSASIIQGRAP
jgi:predicted glycosyltransferase/glycosyltransferase involved in cell wall biosynthesis